MSFLRQEKKKESLIPQKRTDALETVPQEKEEKTKIKKLKKKTRVEKERRKKETKSRKG
jgi:hypothetical protein